MADADLEAADKEAKARIRRADGIKAETAAPGLASVTVKEADAAATEKKGLVDARVLKEKMMAEAEGTEQKGMAHARVTASQADADLKAGQAEAEVKKQKLMADAKGKEEAGLAEVRVQEAEAAAMPPGLN